MHFPRNKCFRIWITLSFQAASFYGFHMKTVRFPYQERTVSISRTYGFHMKTIKVCRLKQRYGLHAKPNVPYRYAIKCKDDVRTVSTEMAWHMQEMHKSIPRKA
ncbi:hypothetical protein B5F71_14440 [Bacteroides sp. An269]|nr:hypothetical protein B5F71_14440 [Bacteroides sp. An269]